MIVSRKRVSPAFVVAMVALFVALGGTAGAVVTAAVPLAKRALVADNAKKLGGQTSSQIVTQAAAQAAQQAAQAPGPASTAAGLVTTKTQTGQIPAGGGQAFNVACDAGQKVLGGGFSSTELVIGLDSYPSNDATWSLFLGNLSDTAPANVSVYALCLK
ncbi:MAG TPA: hypothetical protein VNK94_05075 [Gaiellaceae bacterium]|nr:hypothetical protein [Gaiellaceae bacterium]